MPGSAGCRTRPSSSWRCAVTAALASVRPSAAALGNDAKSAATAGQDHAGAFWDRQDQALRDKYRARRELAAITSLSRVKKCGRVSTNEGGEVSLHHTPGPEGNRAPQASAAWRPAAACGRARCARPRSVRAARRISNS
ncbi:hypothetical protein Ae717Ps2_6876c [Pseudonocardia sp. Ae717_Ps2]|nr:hypothetical protein Ae717Ps2_6876c [Pseudonocardia sp. Ae717_Ps2]